MSKGRLKSVLLLLSLAMVESLNGKITCPAGTYVSIRDCFVCAPGQFKAQEQHQDIYCDACSRCMHGFQVLKECTLTQDTVCHCPPPYSVYSDPRTPDYCSLIKMPFPDYNHVNHRHRPTFVSLPKPIMPKYKGEKTDDYPTQIYAYAKKIMEDLQRGKNVSLPETP
ncbi:ORF91 [Ranid herpesvirus 2]|uniref:ORF91 n=1 Tax=Ranid herpesvirus 2 TaxID=389214 RepID=Q14W15_9VIRU|nr:ORF91 [Ranid herpesvirus 2]ABG25700.1 ORF91 [Ranid herpesvirus 2]